MIRAFAWGLGIVAVIRAFAARWRVLLVWTLSLSMLGAAVGLFWWYEIYLIRDPDVRRERFLERARSEWPCHNHLGTAGPTFNDCVEEVARSNELRYQRERGAVVE